MTVALAMIVQIGDYFPKEQQERIPMNGWLIALVSLMYAGGLFAVAWYGDRSHRFRSPRWQPLVYSLTLAVYFTSWSFFGAVGQAASNVWLFLPIYIAPLLIMTLFWRIQARMIALGKQENITSIADFLAARYGRSRLVAVMATLVAVLGVVPYIALQLKAIVMGYTLLSDSEYYLTGMATSLPDASDNILLVALVLAGFSILFGTRNLDATEHHHGVMLAVAAESLLKLFAFLAVGIFVVWNAPTGWEQELVQLPPPSGDDWFNLMALSLISMAAFFCLPRQFHTTVVENADIQHFRVARRVFPIYLILIALFVPLIAILGKQLLMPGVIPDTFVISLPLGLGNQSLALLAYIGGMSAAIGMVVVSVIALAIMLGNEVVIPLLLRGRRLDKGSHREMRGVLLNIRRGLIVVVLLLSWAFARMIEGQSLAGLGFLSFTALAQLAPGLIGGLLWRNSNSYGVVAGILGGGFCWLIYVVLPAVGITLGPVDTLAGYFPESVNAAGMLVSLLVNLVFYLAGSLLFLPRLQERHQAGRFLDVQVPGENEFPGMNIRVDELEQLVSRFVGEEKVRQLFETYAEGEQSWLFRQRRASPELMVMNERLLASVLGASSARLVMKSLIKGSSVEFHDVENIVGEASSVLEFNRELLQSSIENISQGLSVVDRDLRLVAWNQHYLDIFHYPEGMVRVGRHISELIRYNAEQGRCGPGSPQEHVRKRLGWMQKGTAHRSERTYANGTVIQILGNPMPGGGFVMSFTDITEFRRVENQLKGVNEQLEVRVQQRTRELETLNQDLLEAKRQAEQANSARRRFYAAISHDLMQPMHAARLFTSTLVDEYQDGRVGELGQQLDSALQSAEGLLKDLQELSRLETGKVSKHLESFPIHDLLEPLASEYGVMAEQYQVDFRLLDSKAVIASDRLLLRRILQNFLANAFRYAGHGGGSRVLLACRRDRNGLRIEVRDNGPGIPQEKQKQVFKAFQRLDSRDTQGLGLGLAISRGIARVLEHDLGLRSEEGRGAVFSITVPVGEKTETPLRKARPVPQDRLNGLQVLCIDNDPMILEGLQALLGRWGCEVVTAVDEEGAVQQLEYCSPDIILADYHLDNGCFGVDVIYRIREALERDIPALVVTADATPALKARLRAEEIGFLTKPVKPAALRAMLNRLAVIVDMP
ncbi:PAS domain-containing hybrid sensor histidine kinase/response regulator [Parendozoicomonas haliclonae]|uniref:histidine kinase n=1 Tax=Parendozoicomonas haliclonae TaxID=1960125 RepID=A0A1X7ARJ0_9GAMM|nr:PAS domain-containing hybrid sensor histidine kinase/response regulator [Parendozoicomonas haliclonae]SMA50027.1 Non-motile and phage-resistance protein [Parendozoicomonas haliclonae]